ncbi:MAG: molybdenum ABC transporter ATP-binding protein [Arenicella sp.]|nr:molybdenum ABC transporter ATP-binding protein [Arenicella sp.]
MNRASTHDASIPGSDSEGLLPDQNNQGATEFKSKGIAASAKDALHLKINLIAPLDHFDLSIDVEFHSLVTGLFAPSGAGKTSLLKCLAGLQRGVKGYISFNGRVWLDTQKNINLPPEARGIGYVPQDGLLFPNKNVLQNLTIGAKRVNYSELHSQETRNSVSLESVCQLLELSPLLKRQVSALSGGERQRVALGRAICSRPDVLLLDEPLASLDIQLRRKILPFLQRVREEFNIPIILISHNPVEIQALCDDVLVIDQGRVCTFGRTSKVMLSPEVLKNAQSESFENIFPATLLAQSSSAYVSHLRLGKEGDGPILVTNKIENDSVGLLVGISARDIIIAKSKPEAISAQNIMLARVKSVIHLDGLRMLTASMDANNQSESSQTESNLTGSSIDITAELTAEGWQGLGLSIGDPMYLVIKSTSCILYQ